MGIFYCKRPVTYPEHVLSYERLSNALTKWFGEPAFYAHSFWPENIATSYISEVKRFKVCAKRSSRYEYVNLVLKSYPRKKPRGRSFRSDDFFRNEITFYEKTLPGLLKFQDSRKLCDAFNNHARLCFTYCDERDDEQFFVVLGDARTTGFEVAKQSDMDHGKLVLRTLAKFHAISFALKDQIPEEFERISNEIIETYYSVRFWSWYRKLWAKICAVAIDAVEKEYPDTKYVRKIRGFAVGSAYKELIKAVTDRDNGVILHGNCRSSNYLYKYKNEKPVDVKLVDFQQVRYASPVLDVSSVFYTNQNLMKDYDGLLKYYHGALSSHIIELGSSPDVYTWGVFLEEVRRYSSFGLAFSFEAAGVTATKEIDWESKKMFNIADVLEVENLDGQERIGLANNVRHCTDYGYI